MMQKIMMLFTVLIFAFILAAQAEPRTSHTQVILDRARSLHTSSLTKQDDFDELSLLYQTLNIGDFMALDFVKLNCQPNGKLVLFIDTKLCQEYPKQVFQQIHGRLSSVFSHYYLAGGKLKLSEMTRRHSIVALDRLIEMDPQNESTYRSLLFVIESNDCQKNLNPLTPKQSEVADLKAESSNEESTKYQETRNLVEHAAIKPSEIGNTVEHVAIKPQEARNPIENTAIKPSENPVIAINHHEAAQQLTVPPLAIMERDLLPEELIRLMPSLYPPIQQKQVSPGQTSTTNHYHTQHSLPIHQSTSQPKHDEILLLL